MQLLRMHRSQRLLAIALLAAATAPASPLPGPQQQDVLRAMRLANSYFMTKWPDPGKEIVTNVARPSHIWTRAVYYEGLMALYSIDPQKQYLDYTIDWGSKHDWTPRNGITDRNADDQCAGQTWIDLYNLDPQPQRIGPIKATIDNMVHSDNADDWHWIDAIQMAMPVFTRLGVVYHDTSYFRKMYDCYHYTKTGLYNPEEHLWWRDKDFIPPYKEPNGQNCYWSRGNGWVLAALVRVLSILPLNDPHRAEYLQDYKDMAEALVPLQRADGYWNCSLHDSTHFGGKELTGTALFTYGIAWGIRQGFLDKKTWYPVVAKAWDAMVAGSLHPDGMLGWVQGTGKEPKDGQPVTYDKIPDFEDYGLGCFLLAGSEVYQVCTPPAANLDESKVPPFTEPALDLTTAKNWEATQRPALLQLFAKNVYGRVPAKKIPVTADVTRLAAKKEITLHFLPGDTAASLHMVLYLPENVKHKVPVFVGYSFTPNTQTETSPQWPIKEILSRGYGVAFAWYWDIEPDRPDGWQTGIRTRLADKLNIQPWEWSAMSAWAWGLSRMVDYLETDPQVDTAKLIVIGHSRLGKAAVWAGANDRRFAMVVSNESGEGGAALGKRDYGETIAIINDKFPWWFGANYKQYGSNPAAMPTDQYQLLALIAPRPLYVASAIGDQWSDPKGEFLSARLADPVYHLYRKKGLETDSMPPLEHPVGETIRYHIRTGKHDLTGYDWQQYMDFADRQLLHRKAAPGVPSRRITYNFNPGWLLFVGDPVGTASTAASSPAVTPPAADPAFPDNTWQHISLPHAFNEDDAFKKAIQDLTTGIAWYRKHFRMPPGDKGKKVFLECEGIRQAGEFYCNGHWIGRSENGVMAFGFDLTPWLRPDSDNIIAARIDNHWDYKEKATGSAFEWNDHNFYANYGGINKNVWLHVMNPLHQTLPLYSSLGATGVYIYAKDIDIPAKTATVTAESEVTNQDDRPRSFQYMVVIRDPDGRIVKTMQGESATLAPGQTTTVHAAARVDGLHFWSWGYGYLYTVSTLLKADAATIDSVTTVTGFRKTTFTNGMLTLNDRPIQVKGYAQRTTNEWPAIGLSVPPWLSDLSNHLMVESNGNLVRWMHVTPWRQDVLSCDRVGLMESMPAGDAEGEVEGRRWQQRVELMRDAIIYNRNNPSIIFYECGNKGISDAHMQEMKAVRDRFDPYGGRAIGAREMLGSHTAEYGGEMLYIDKSAAKPLWEMEYSRDEGLRKYWDNYSPPYHRDGDGPLYRGEAAGVYNRNQDSHAIEDIARWYDYWLERPGTGHRVSAGGVNIIFSESNTHYRGAENYRRSGEVDALRIPKDGFYAHRIMWDGWVDVERPRIHILGHWNYSPGVKKDVYVVSSADKVQLFLNGRSLGWGKQSNRFLFTFPDITWQPGTISATGYDAEGKALCTASHETAGKAAAIKLTLQTAPGGFKADGADLALVQVEVVDAKGRRCPTDLSMIHFDLTGAAEWRGGMAQGPDNYILSKHLPVECGVNRILIRSTSSPGAVTLVATAQGLTAASLSFEAHAIAVQDGLTLEMPAAGLPARLDRGPTPATPAIKTTRTTLAIATATAGANPDLATRSYDDNETTDWHNDGALSTAWIEYRLQQPAPIDEVVLKLNNFRTRSYPLAVFIDGKEVWHDSTPHNLGYTHIRFEPHTGSTVRIQLTAAADNRHPTASNAQASIGTEVNGKPLDDGPGSAEAHSPGRLSIIETEVYSSK